ncbi:MAG: class C sortase [Lachnospiraceae bacterium]|jgi:sortase A|nr:class C sortase [Lachnospiraceae bacterium]
MKKTKKIIYIVTTILVFIIGFTILFLPTIRNIINERRSSYAINNYDKKYKNLSSEKIKQEWKLAKDYNKNLKLSSFSDPFEKSDRVNLKKYNQVLNLTGDGMMGHIEIPKINVHLPIYHGTDKKALLKGVGHLEESHLPIGGKGTHAVLTGHTGMEAAKYFTDLTNLKQGDKFYIKVLDETHAYEISQIKKVLPDQVNDLVPVSDKDLVTLVTCTPYGINSHRLLVTGERVPLSEKDLSENNRKNTSLLSKEMMIVAALVILVVSVLIIVIWRKRRNKRKV